MDTVRWRWNALGRMSWPERAGAARAFLALACVRLALTGLGFRWTHGALASLVERAAPRPAAVVMRTDRPDPDARVPGGPILWAAVAVERAVDRAARLGPSRPSCLPRALTLWWLLRRQGLAAELHIGSRRAAGGIEAHAWVEHDGCVLGDSPDVRDRFAPFRGPILPTSVQGSRLRARPMA